MVSTVSPSTLPREPGPWSGCGGLSVTHEGLGELGT